MGMGSGRHQVSRRAGLGSVVTYAQARTDHEYLWAYGPMEDISGAYVDQDDLKLLLECPTKTTARDCYERQIIAWFQRGPEVGAGEGWQTDPKVREIGSRYCFTEELNHLEHVED